MPYVLASALMSIIVHYLVGFVSTPIYKLLIGVLSGGTLYLIITKVCFKQVFNDLITIIKNRYDCNN